MKPVFFFAFCSILFCRIASAANCEGLATLPLPHATIGTAELVPAGTFTPKGPAPIHDLPAFCRVAAVLKPSPDSNIRIEVWMPVSGWNGRYEGTGNGGYAGEISYDALADGLRRGFAVANTDMGTAPSSPENGDSLIGHPEKWTDWGWRSTHEMTVAAKRILRAYYGRNPARSYFASCSTGGEQGLMEAQRFPYDYDGIIAGAPANNRTRLHMDILWNYKVAERIPADKLPAITRAVLQTCASEKAVASDGFLSSPSDCHWDPGSIVCKSGDAPNCLTTAQAEAVRSIYDGPENPVTHASIYPGLPRGSESGWQDLISRAKNAPYDSLFKWTFGPTWNWRKFDFNRDVAKVDAKLAPVVNATDPNLHTFKTHAHKLLTYHGWADWLVAPQESVNYYKSVEDTQTRAAARHHRSNAEETQEFYRLFMVPGMSHCGGGPGLNTLDALPALELWVEKGIAPQKIIAKRMNKNTVEMTRPVCPYPQTARYNGTGNPNDAANFSCIASGSKSR
jgi:feruloyl esterase